MKWNHNIHYHRAVLAAMPSNCQRALDAGCGRGDLTRELAERSRAVVALDMEYECLTRTKLAMPNLRNINFVQGNILTPLFTESSFDFIAVIATLHHLPIRAALQQLRNLLRPGGVLAVVGLYRGSTPLDFAIASVAMPVSRANRLIRGEQQVEAPLTQPTDTLERIRQECHLNLPGGVFRRRFFFRYTFVWQKPLVSL